MADKPTKTLAELEKRVNELSFELKSERAGRLLLRRELGAIVKELARSGIFVQGSR